MASSYTDEELTFITKFLDQASHVLDEQIDQLSSKLSSKSSS
ncbi:hypothetical protein [Paenibacillus sp. Soil750]|nr:hypothetical protein [Paenibacillus sp. Soil750]